MPGGGPNFGWTLYAPLSTTYGPPSTDYLIVAIHLMGISSVLGAINIIATIINLRAPGMTLDENAIVRLDLVYYGIFVDWRHAGVCWCCDHDFV